MLIYCIYDLRVFFEAALGSPFSLQPPSPSSIIITPPRATFIIKNLSKYHLSTFVLGYRTQKARYLQIYVLLTPNGIRPLRRFKALNCV
jgi:hypothetical protein